MRKIDAQKKADEQTKKRFAELEKLEKEYSKKQKLLNKQEKENRNIYTGSFGYLKFNGDMRFNIIIRSILNYQNQSEISVASGVVIDSNASHEFNENYIKAKALIDL